MLRHNTAHSVKLTHCVASNIMMSSGSPVSFPSTTVSEWQVAMVAMKGDSTGKTAGSRTGSSQNFEFWDGNILHKFSPSSVKVPVYINNNI